MASAFDTALSSAQTTVTGYATSALPVVAAISLAFLGVKYARKIINRF
jgi:hypothetical protein